MSPCQYAEDIAERLTERMETNEGTKAALKLVIAGAIQKALEHAANRIIDRSFLEGSEMCMDSQAVSDHVLGVIAMDLIRMEN